MKPIPFITLVMFLLPWQAFAQATQPSIGLITDVEDGRKMVQATVTLDSKPIENVALQFYVQRTFGNLLIGQDTTLDDGTAAVPFPADLPGASDGKLHLIARIKASGQYSSVSASAVFQADIPQAPVADAFPRALWAPQAPLALMLSIFVVLAAVWLSYLFVVSRILAIRAGAHP